MGLLGKFINFFKIRIKASSLKKELKILQKNLRLFQPVIVDNKIHNLAFFIKEKTSLSKRDVQKISSSAFSSAENKPCKH